MDISNEFLEFRDCNICGCKEFDIVYRWHANYYNHDKYITFSWDGGGN